MKNVLFLCTGNSARSILSEGYMTHAGRGRFKGFSAGSKPTGRVNPFAIATLEAAGIHLEAPASKSWDAFAAPGAPKMDIIITVCDSAAGEVCPIWPGHPTTAHWGLPDPAAVTGTDSQKRAAFEEVFKTIRALIDGLIALPEEDLSASRLRPALGAIGDRILAGEGLTQ